MGSQEISCPEDAYCGDEVCGHTRSDRIRNEDIQDKVGQAVVVDKMRKARLR